MPKISAKFDRGHSLRGRRMQVWWVKIGDFRQITGYISKTVQDGRMVSIKVDGDIAEWSLSAPDYPNLYILHRFSYLCNECSKKLQIWSVG